MSGIYIHIPFCKQACNYCNFYFSTSTLQKDALFDHLIREIKLHDNWPFESIETLYFGGGTPSIFSGSEINEIVKELHKYFSIDKAAEITLEANPEDLTQEYLKDLKTAGVNRLSIGVQSFVDRDLEFMRRSHNSEEAAASIQQALLAGFDNISIDLIYGTPGLSDVEWINNIDLAIQSEVTHLSAYGLTVEKGTALYHQIRKGKVTNVNDDQVARQFEILMDKTATSGFEHYEISNFCKPGYKSKHNSAYWENKPYLGLGPSAHSYNLDSRYWNIANIKKYCDQIMKNQLPWEREVIDVEQKANEEILTRIRTSEGLDLKSFHAKHGEQITSEVISNASKIEKEYLVLNNDKIFLTRKGKLLADHITVNIMI